MSFEKYTLTNVHKNPNYVDKNNVKQSAKSFTIQLSTPIKSTYNKDDNTAILEYHSFYLPVEYYENFLGLKNENVILEVEHVLERVNSRTGEIYPAYKKLISTKPMTADDILEVIDN